MTKYIMAGGNDRKIDGYPLLLKRELPKNLSELSFLSCFFSRPEKAWSTNADDWRTWTLQNLGITKYDFATYNNFEEKLHRADIVYFHGGDNWLLLDAISKYGNFEQKLKGKIVIGSSAGSNMLAKNFWSATYQKAGIGLGIIDLNIMVHYGAGEVGGVIRSENDWAAEEQKFSKIIKSSKIIRIPEGSFITFSKT